MYAGVTVLGRDPNFALPAARAMALDTPGGQDVEDTSASLNPRAGVIDKAKKQEAWDNAIAYRKAHMPMVVAKPVRCGVLVACCFILPWRVVPTRMHGSVHVHAFALRILMCACK